MREIRKVAVPVLLIAAMLVGACDGAAAERYPWRAGALAERFGVFGKDPRCLDRHGDAWRSP